MKAKIISLAWRIEDEITDVTSDRTLIYSLYCHADVPFKTKTKLNFKKQIARKMVTPESGFDEMSELSSESKNTFPSVPPSLLGSRNISLLQLQESNEESSKSHEQNLVLKPTPGNITSLLPEPIRLPKITDTKKPHPPPGRKRPTTTNQDHSGTVLNLPPLVMNKPTTAPSDNELMSVTTSGVFGDSEDGSNSSNGRMSTVGENEMEGSHDAKMSKTDSSTSFSDLDTSEDLSTSQEGYVNVGRFCHGYAFEEIYKGEKTSFRYSGLVSGATYYFRVRCHNAAGWGPWSDTVKCITTN